jgi:chromosome segregation protein
MLKRLELVGFKSFADKTQFDFSTGVTAIVGPNGSGKSNIVDAVRWILGEQSAKSLRGGEMADVIFNGSTSRRSLGLAEVTMTFDNTRRQLATEADEVQITRRVYRSGEGEYLINHQLSRLKDIKDLFLGSGAGSDAYCIIEQGRVESLLQSSTKDRRTIFEEAAGISRFRAKKTETLRKLERVDQNLQRLRDIVDEVDKQLRSVKLQAAKAQRFQEHSQRLQELRVGLGLEEFGQLSESLTREQGLLDAVRTDLEQRSAEAQAWEAELRRLDVELARLEEEVHRREAQLAQARQQIAGEEATLGHERNVTVGLEADLVRGRTTMAELNGHVAHLRSVAAQATAEAAVVEAQSHVQRQQVRALDDELQSVIVRLALLQRQVQADKNEHLEQMRQSTTLQNNVIRLHSQATSLRKEYDRHRQRSDNAAETLVNIDVELESMTETESAMQARLTAARQNLAEAGQERDQLRQKSEAAAARLADLRAQRSGLASRIEILAGLERTHEGLGAGVREVFALLETAGSERWGSVLGMVADFLTVPRRHAALIDLALGDAAQRFLVRDLALLDDGLRGLAKPFSSRVSFAPLASAITPAHAAAFADLQTSFPDAWLLASVVGCENAELTGLPERLLGNVIVAADLVSARAMQTAEQAGSAPFRYVTKAGELLEPDGTVTLGRYHAETGILSRKSELRELRQQTVGLDRETVEVENEVADLRDRSTHVSLRANGLQKEIEVFAEQVADLRSQIGQHRQKRAGLHEEVQLSRSEMSGLEGDLRLLEEGLQQAQAQADAGQQQVQALQARLEQADQEIRNREELRQVQEAARTTAKVALAQVEERFSALRARQRQAEADLQQRQQERTQGEIHLATIRARLAESQMTMLRASSALAQAYLDKEAAERNGGDLVSERDRTRQARTTLVGQLHGAQTAWRAQHDQVHNHELAVNDFRHRLTALSDRLREDYQIELEALYQQQLNEPDAARPPLPERQAANAEIDDLRRKLSRLGSVNLEALQELAELEKRSSELQAQFADLTSAQKSLQDIIAKINADSKKLFADTFQTIRGHFQELFRKLFGGGMADVVLEDENDLLESGIEIIARPPGKELRGISLMSGGEKTMTAVALLLAIFRSKPSPFCLLDEVDAALDEANIGRFTAVLRDFLDLSQFILITHSKKTMACADVLYGITMQESGISKRVAVRFEDWEDETPPTEAASQDGEESFAGR